MIIILRFAVSQEVTVITIDRLCWKQQFIRLQRILICRPAFSACDGF